MPIVQTDACRCSLCGYTWIPGQWRKIEGFPLPTFCAGCKSARWNGLDGAGQVKVKRIVEPKVEQRIVEQEVVAPIAVQSSAKERPAAREKKPWKEVKAPAPGKKKLCPHGFAVVSGITACARCN